MADIHVLVIDDSADDAVLIVRALGRAGLDITSSRADTADGVAAALAERVPDVVISDYNMPGFGVEDVSWDDHDSLAAEHAAFEASILDGAPVVVNARVGRRALAAALAVAQSMRECRERMMGSGLIKPVEPDAG